MPSGVKVERLCAQVCNLVHVKFYISSKWDFSKRVPFKVEEEGIFPDLISRMFNKRSNWLICETWKIHIYISYTVRSNEQVWTGLQWWPPDVTSRGTRAGGPRSDVRGGMLYSVRSNVSWVMVLWRHHLCEQTDVKTLLSRNFVGGR